MSASRDLGLVPLPIAPARIVGVGPQRGSRPVSPSREFPRWATAAPDDALALRGRVVSQSRRAVVDPKRTPPVGARAVATVASAPWPDATCSPHAASGGLRPVRAARPAKRRVARTARAR